MSMPGFWPVAHRGLLPSNGVRERQRPRVRYGRHRLFETWARRRGRGEAALVRELHAGQEAAVPSLQGAAARNYQEILPGLPRRIRAWAPDEAADPFSVGTVLGANVCFAAPSVWQCMRLHQVRSEGIIGCSNGCLKSSSMIDKTTILGANGDYVRHLFG